MSAPHLDDERREVPELTGPELEHVAACEPCRVARRDALARQRLLRGLTPYTLSDMAFRRVEARLMEQVEEGLVAPASPWRWLWWLGPAAAALLALAWVTAAPGPRPGARPTPAPAPVAVVAAPRVEALTVLRASPGARVQRGSGWEPARAGAVVAVGEAVQGELWLAPASAAGWMFEVDGAATVGGAGTLVLGAGEVRARVAGAEATIVAGTLRVTASDAVFLVNSSAAEVIVEVSAGEVELTDASAAVRRTLKAPARVRWAPGSNPVAMQATGVVVAAAPGQPWVRLDASSLPAGARLSLDGLAIGVAPLELLVAAGRHRLGVAAPGGPVRESWLELTGDYRLTPSVLPEPEQEAPPPDEAAVARVQAELQRQVPKLASCYEKWLKQNPSAAADVELRLLVSATGRVRRAQVLGRDLSAVSARCLERTALGLALPALGTEVELELPVRLTTGR